MAGYVKPIERLDRDVHRDLVYSSAVKTFELKAHHETYYQDFDLSSQRW